MRYPAINDYHHSSLRNALRLLNLFSVDEPELQLEDMASKLEVGQSTAYRLVHTLIEEGFIVRDSFSQVLPLGRFRFGLKSYDHYKSRSMSFVAPYFRKASGENR